jgi:hypothetical protein
MSGIFTTAGMLIGIAIRDATRAAPAAAREELPALGL